MTARPFRAALLTLTALAACKAGPNYLRPAATAPVPAFKEAALFRPATPGDAIDRGPWWELFGDPDLNRLAALVATHNQSVLASLATYRQELAIVREQRAALFPTVGLSAGYTRSGSFGSSGGNGSGVITGGTGTGGTGTGGTGTGGTGNGTGGTGSGGTGTGATGTGTIGTGGSGAIVTTGSGNRFTLGASASWTPDLFGGTRRGIEQARANSEAAAADLANLRLQLESELVLDYLQLRSFDAERAAIDSTVVAYRRDYQITNNRYRVGVASKQDVLQAETQLLNAEVSSADLVRSRGILEHAIAVLTGAPPATLAIPQRAQWTPLTPTPPPGVPSALLERRPDIAAAERRVKAANAGIGVETAALFPDVTLSGSLQQSAGSVSALFATAANFWSLGANIAYTLLDFGARRARIAQARALWENATANYRQTVLTAFQQVEDQLLATRLYDTEYALQQRSAAASSEAEQIARNQYKAGTADFTTVIVAETTALTARRTAIEAGFARQSAAVQLIQALGGGWSVGTAQPPVGRGR